MDSFRTILGFPFVAIGTAIKLLGELIGGGPYDFGMPYDRYHAQRDLELGEAAARELSSRE